MATSIDELIQQIELDAQGYTTDATVTLSNALHDITGSNPTIDPSLALVEVGEHTVIGIDGKAYVIKDRYVAQSNFTTLPVELPPDIQSQITDTLKSVFDSFFPNLEDTYNSWVTKLTSAISSGPRYMYDNSAASTQAQLMDTQAGIRASRTIRAEVSNKGYMMPPGLLVGMILDETDIRTERLVGIGIENATTATMKYVEGYKAVINAALAANDARIAAVEALAGYIRAEAGLIEATAQAKASVLQVRAAAAKAALAYYNAEVRLDEVNTSVFKANQDLALRRYTKEGSLWFRNMGDQVEDKMVLAEIAAKLAQSSFSAMNTVASASTYGFG